MRKKTKVEDFSSQPLQVSIWLLWIVFLGKNTFYHESNKMMVVKESLRPSSHSSDLADSPWFALWPQLDLIITVISIASPLHHHDSRQPKAIFLLIIILTWVGIYEGWNGMPLYAEAHTFDWYDLKVGRPGRWAGNRRKKISDTKNLKIGRIVTKQVVTVAGSGKDWQSSCRKRENGWESTSWQLGLVPIHLLAPHRIEYQYSNNIINSARISTNTSTSTITSTSINTSTRESCKIGLVPIHPSTTQTPSLLGARLPPQRTDAPK